MWVVIMRRSSLGMPVRVGVGTVAISVVVGGGVVRS